MINTPTPTPNHVFRVPRPTLLPRLSLQASPEGRPIHGLDLRREASGVWSLRAHKGPATRARFSKHHDSRTLGLRLGLSFSHALCLSLLHSAPSLLFSAGSFLFLIGVTESLDQHRFDHEPSLSQCFFRNDSKPVLAMNMCNNAMPVADLPSRLRYWHLSFSITREKTWPEGNNNTANRNQLDCSRERKRCPCAKMASLWTLYFPSGCLRR